MSLELYKRTARVDNYFSEAKYIYKIGDVNFYFSFSKSGKKMFVNYFINHGKPLNISAYKKVFLAILRLMNKTGATTLTYLPRNKRLDSYLSKKVGSVPEHFTGFFPKGTKTISKEKILKFTLD